MTARAACVLAVAAGCDPLAHPAYIGEPMITLVGTFSEDARPIGAEGALALMWQDAAGAGGPGAAVTPLPIELSSLGAFTVDVTVPPPREVRFGFDDGGPQIAEAYLYVVTGVPVVSADMVLGLDPMHVLVFADGDTAGDAAAYLADAPAGYHLRRFTPTDAPSAPQQQLVARCVAGGAAPVACEARRRYRLDAIADDTPLRIVLRVR